jgi:fibronectin-binding autotransporter adhesin
MTGLNLIGAGTTTNTTLLIQDSALNNRLSLTDSGLLNLSQAALSANWYPLLTTIAGNITAIPAASELADYVFNSSSTDSNFNSGGTLAAGTRTKTWVDGTVTTQRDFYFRGTTYNKTTTSAIFTNAYTLYIDPPLAGTGVTLTNVYSLGLGGSLALTGSSSQTINFVNSTSAVIKAPVGNLTISSATSGFSLILQAGGVTRLLINGPSGDVTFTQSSMSSSWGPAIVCITGNHTAITAATELADYVLNSNSTDVNFNSGGTLPAGTRTKTWADGTVATQRDFYFRGTTYNKTTTSATFTNAYSLYIDPPVAGTGVTITSNWALGLNGNLLINSGGKITSNVASTYNAPGLTFQTGGGVTRLNIANNGNFTFTGNGSTSNTFVTFTQGAISSGSNPGLLWTAAAHTNQTLSTELPDWNLNLSATLQFATGSVTTQRSVRIQPRTYGFVGVSTITTGATLSVGGAPIGGTNATITTSIGVNVESIALANVTTGYGAYFNAPTGATNNYALGVTGAVALGGSAGTSGQVFTSGGAGASPSWTTVSSGITNSALNTELMMSNGTNAVSSGVFADASGDLTLGSASLAGGTRAISTTGSASQVGLTLSTKGTSLISLMPGGGANFSFDTYGTLLCVISTFSVLGGYGAIFGTADLSGGSTYDVTLKSGTVTSGTGNAGNVNITTGVPLSGTEGSLNIQTRSTAKLGFYGVTGITRPTTSGGAAAFVANTSLIANDTATWGGYTIGQVVEALQNLGLLT